MERLYLILAILLIYSHEITFARINDAEKKIIALTFDDGPSKENTSKLLDILEKHNIKATFFVLGKNSEVFPEIIKKIAQFGHEIGNHSYSHPMLTHLNKEKIKKQITDTNEIVKEICGKQIKFFRPPYRDMNKRIRKIISETGLKTVTWTIDPQDWRNLSANKLTKNVMDHVHPGGVILFHERNNTIEALPKIIQKLKDQEYKFVTLSEIPQKTSWVCPELK